MLNKCLEQLGGKLGEQWAALILTPAFLFWAGGLCAWIQRHHLISLQHRTESVSSLGMALLIISCLIGLAICALAVQKLAPRVLRILEGNWKPWMEWLRVRMVGRQTAKAGFMSQRLQVLEAKRRELGLSFTEDSEHVALDKKLRGIPSESYGRMATRFGNILRAAEQWPNEKYGLDAAVCWPRLWLLLPEDVKKDLTDARASLDAGAVAWVWSALFIIWTVWAWWALVVGIIGVLVAYQWILGAAEVYGDLIESTFDVHRTKLYEALRWPLPMNAEEEVKSGHCMTEYLWRGSDQPSTVFINR